MILIENSWGGEESSGNWWGSGEGVKNYRKWGEEWRWEVGNGEGDRGMGWVGSSGEWILVGDGGGGYW